MRYLSLVKLEIRTSPCEGYRHSFHSVSIERLLISHAATAGLNGNPKLKEVIAVL